MGVKLLETSEGLAVLIDPALPDRLRIDRDTPLEVTTDGVGLYVRPTGVAVQTAFVESARRMMEIHAETFRKLAESSPAG